MYNYGMRTHVINNGKRLVRRQRITNTLANIGCAVLIILAPMLLLFI